MDEIKNYSNILDSKLTNTINSLEEKSLAELDEITNLKKTLFDIQSKIKLSVI